MRGDRPRVYGKNYNWEMFTPHARGSTHFKHGLSQRLVVYPACAGIDLTSSDCLTNSHCLPRMRGDRPLNWSTITDNNRFTPHARGSTLHASGGILQDEVYPACAGIDPRDPSFSRSPGCLPRMRGDRPEPAPQRSKKREFTPHARGSTIFYFPL